MKKILLSAYLLAIVLFTNAQTTYKPSAANLESRKDFQDMKFGLFIHWGIYSILGDGEWVMHTEKIPYDNYKRLANFFNPQEFNAKQWVQMAKNAGMKYITITSRHHDGFSMFQTKASPYNIVDATPYKKDPLMELAKECEKEGIELHFYYSLLDWGRPDYGFGKPIVNGAPADTDWNSYISFMKTQLTELITKYPGVKGIWFDGHWERPTVNWHYNEIYSLIHSLNPKILVGNNHHLAPFEGEDFQMFEKDLPGENTTGFSGNSKIGNLPLETCETINNSWGFNIKDNNYKSVKQIIHYLVNAAGRNANFLLNVGPMPNGKIQSEFTDTLAVVGNWVKNNGESIYGTRGNVIPPQDWGVVTSKDKVYFAHVLKPVGKSYIFIPGLKGKVTAASVNKQTLKYKQQPEGVFVYLDQVKQDPYDTVIKLNLN
ncbi:alpha-L-fucosidase [Rubrolithibacter danxiaensis]|uniref:alpha-L-fucosidase n=1 Tax=Rubrolithibacter danxiaensis TaxID=3390805 RepID=UPI003BF7FE9C